jgi:nitroreductase
MEIFEAIAKRYSYRGGYTEAAVGREDLRKIVQAGIQAPSGCNAQTTHFVMVVDAELVAKIAAIIDRPFVFSARAMIVCVVDHRPVYQDKSFAAEDCAAAVENMYLAIAALGYATVWLDGVLRNEGKAAQIAELLGVPEPLEVRIVLPLGVPKEPGVPREKKPFAERASFNRYGQAHAAG